MRVLILLTCAAASDPHLREAGHAHHAQKAHHAHAAHAVPAAHAHHAHHAPAHRAPAASFAGQTSAESAAALSAEQAELAYEGGSGSAVIAALHGGATKKAIDILKDMAELQDAEFVRGGDDKEYVAEEVVDKIDPEAALIIYGEKGVKTLNLEGKGQFKEPNKYWKKMEAKKNDYLTDSGDVKDTATSKYFGFANTPLVMKAEVDKETRNVNLFQEPLNWEAGNPQSIGDYESLWKHKIGGESNNPNSVSTKLEEAETAHKVVVGQLDEKLAPAVVQQQLDELNEVYEALVGTGAGDGAINDIEAKGDAGIKEFADQALKNVGSPGGGGGCGGLIELEEAKKAKILDAVSCCPCSYKCGCCNGGCGGGGCGKCVKGLQDLSDKYAKYAEERIGARRQTYLGNSDVPDLSGGLEGLTAQTSRFGAGGLSKTAFDVRAKLKESQALHSEAAQAYASMGAEMAALVAAAARRLDGELIRFKSQTSRLDKAEQKKWYDALDGSEGAFPQAKALLRNLVKEYQGHDFMQGAVNDYKSSRVEQTKEMNDVFQEARREVGKAAQLAKRAELSTKTLKAKAFKANMELDTMNRDTTADMLKSMKNTLTKSTSDLSEQVKPMMDDLKTLADNTGEQVEHDTVQMGKEAQEEIESHFNDAQHKLREIREGYESEYKAEAKKMHGLAVEENKPPQTALQELSAELTRIDNTLKEEKNNPDSSVFLEAHSAALAKSLDAAIEKVTNQMDHLGRFMDAGTPDESLPDSVVVKAWTAQKEAAKSWADPSDESGALQDYATGQANAVAEQIRVYKERMNLLIQKMQETKAKLVTEKSNADSVDTRIHQVLSDDGAIKALIDQVGSQTSTIDSNSESASKALKASLVQRDKQLDADITAKVLATEQAAVDKEDTTETRMDQGMRAEMQKKDATVERVEALEESAKEAIKKVEDGDANSAGRAAAETLLQEGDAKQAQNAASYKNLLDAFDSTQQQEVKNLLQEFDDLQAAIPAKFGQVTTAAKRAFADEYKSVDDAIARPGGKLATNSNAVAALKSDADNKAVTDLHTVTSTGKESADRVDAMNRAYEHVTKTYSEEELGQLKQADLLYKELDTFRSDLSASSILALGDKQAMVDKLEEREKLLLGKLHDHLGDADEYERAKIQQAVLDQHGKMKDLVNAGCDSCGGGPVDGFCVDPSSDLSCEDQKQAAMEQLELELQTKLSDVSDEGHKAEKLMYLLGMEITSSAKESSKAQLKEDAAVKTGLTEEAKERKEMGADDNDVLESELTDAEKVTNILTDIEVEAAGMLHNQESGWRGKLDAITTQLSQELGADLRTGTTEVRDLASAAVNESDRLSYQIASDQRQLESSVTGMAESLHESQAYIQAHLQSEQDEIQGLNASINGTVEKPMKKLASKLDGLYRDATNMHVEIHSAILAATQNGVDTEKALAKAGEFEVKDQEEAEKFVPEAHALFSRHAATAGWFAAYEAGDLAFKRAVSAKLAELGHDIDLEGIEGAVRPKLSSDAVDAELASELDENQRKLAAQLNAMYAESDAEIARLRDDESLSDAERKRRIAEIEAENSAKAAKLFAQQAAMKARQAALEAALAKYQTKVAAAEDQARGAIAAGVLSPSAINTTRKLADANVQLARVRMKPLFSVIELKSLGVDPDSLSAYVDHLGQLHKANAALAQKDADLQTRVEHLERILEA